MGILSLSFPLQQLHWDPHVISVRLKCYTVPQAWYLLLSYCGWGLESAGKPESGCSPASPCTTSPPGAQRLCSAAQQPRTATESGHQALGHPARTVNVQPGVPCWESVVGAKSWGACPNALLCDVSLALGSDRSALEGYSFFFLVEVQKCQPCKGNIRFLVVAVPASVVAPGVTALPLVRVTAWVPGRAWDFLMHRQPTSNTAVGCCLRNKASTNVPSGAFGKTDPSLK